ncbi:MAG: DNA topoisomerase, partial [Polyangiaceae bacterium]|nr:DNA topoisomerase [Polyangiaceae bacterium]
EQVACAASGAHGTVAERRDEPRRDAPPLPYALSDLQIDAGRRLGLSAKQVLDAAQSLYETHRLTTYPRSDCAHLPAEHHGQARAVLDAAARHVPALAALMGHADLSLRSRAWNDKKVTAHHAIIPTPAQSDGQGLSPAEAAVYELIVRRYLAQFFPAFAYVQSEVLVDLGADRFRAVGREIVDPGWKAVLAPAPEADEEGAAASDEPSNATLPAVRPGDTVRALEVRVVDKMTQAPKPFTDASLIQAMCKVARFVSDPALKQILSDVDGIGTEATRAAIVEKLFERSFIERRQKAVVSTATGRALVDALPSVATTPDITALWEVAMRAIVDGKQPLHGFLERIERQLRDLVAQGKAAGAIRVAPAPSQGSPTSSQGSRRPDTSRGAPSGRRRGTGRASRSARPAGR